MVRNIVRLTNPSVIGPLLLLIIFFIETHTPGVLLGGALTLLLFLAIIPLSYVLLRMRATHCQGDPTLYLKQHPGDILVLEIFCGIPCWLVLVLIKTSVICTDALAALLVTALVIAVINFFYRASFHLAAFAVIIYIIVEIWGTPFLFLSLVVPAIAWAKFYLREHTPLQMLLGAIIGILTAFLINYRF